jgi:hypothetical protein
MQVVTLLLVDDPVPHELPAPRGKALARPTLTLMLPAAA